MMQRQPPHSTVSILPEVVRERLIPLVALGMIHENHRLTHHLLKLADVHQKRNLTKPTPAEIFEAASTLVHGLARRAAAVNTICNIVQRMNGASNRAVICQTIEGELLEIKGHIKNAMGAQALDAIASRHAYFLRPFVKHMDQYQTKGGAEGMEWKKGLQGIEGLREGRDLVNKAVLTLFRLGLPDPDRSPYTETHDFYASIQEFHNIRDLNESPSKPPPLSSEPSTCLMPEIIRTHLIPWAALDLIYSEFERIHTLETITHGFRRKFQRGEGSQWRSPTDKELAKTAAVYKYASARREGAISVILASAIQMSKMSGLFRYTDRRDQLEKEIETALLTRKEAIRDAMGAQAAEVTDLKYAIILQPTIESYERGDIKDPTAIHMWKEGERHTLGYRDGQEITYDVIQALAPEIQIPTYVPPHPVYTTDFSAVFKSRARHEAAKARKSAPDIITIPPPRPTHPTGRSR